MNLVSAAPLWLLLVFGCAMIAAAVEDAKRLRISNVTSLVVLAGAVAAALIEGPTWALWQNLAVFVAILVLGTAAFSAGWLGGGDVKLLAAAGLWFDFSSAIWFVAIVFLCGGLIAILYLLSRLFGPSGKRKKYRRVPYGMAIALGALVVTLLGHGSFEDHGRPLPPIRIAAHRG